ncbi:MAG: hypothetical protein KJ732_03510 [Candidatus Margulisbacteria bacterium]|nr:hypothetical protein [Candidatus Margulisiibacteriota bacterium]
MKSKSAKTLGVLWIAFFGLVFLALLVKGCGQSTNTGSGSVSSTIAFYTEASNTTPVFIPSARVTAASTWESGNTMYGVFYALREYLHPQDEGVIDRANLYRLLYDVETLLNAMSSEVVALATPEVIVPPFNFGNNATYETAVNDATNERAAAVITSGTTTRGIVTWIWRDTADPNHNEYGVLEASMNNATKDLSVDFIFCVDYNASDTLCDYNNRTKISGNSGTHAFEFVQTIAGATAVNSQLVGKGVSQGAGENFLLKIMNSNNDGFSSARYLVVSAEATETTLMNFDVSSEAFTDPASLSASVASYKDYVVNTPFFAFSDILSNTAALNAGNPQAGTIYLNY